MSTILGRPLADLSDAQLRLALRRAAWLRSESHDPAERARAGRTLLALADERSARGPSDGASTGLSGRRRAPLPDRRRAGGSAAAGG